MFMYGSEKSVTELPNDAILFLKVYNEFLSAGVDGYDNLPQLLKQADAPDSLKKNYIALYQVNNLNPFAFSLSYFICGENCLSECVREWWRINVEIWRSTSTVRFIEF